MENDKRRRLYEITIYEENVDKMAYAYDLPNCKYYHCFHDKDMYDEDRYDEKGNLLHKKGDLKVSHHHLLLYFNDGITKKSLCKKLHIEKENLVKYWGAKDPKGRKDYRIQYLVHYKSKDPYKVEYDIEDIVTNDENIYKYFGNDDSKQSKDIVLLFDFFDSREGRIISYRTFLNFVYEQGLWGTYQRNASIFNRLFDEHNSNVKLELLPIFK